MKKLMLTMIAVAMMTTTMAQEETSKRGPQAYRSEMIARRTQDMKEKYSLTDDQVEKIKAINEKYMGQRRPRGNRGDQRSHEQFKGQTDSTMQAKPEMMERQGRMRPQHGQRGGNGQRGGFDMQKYNEEIKAVMTESQRKAYEKDLAKMHAVRMKKNNK